MKGIKILTMLMALLLLSTAAFADNHTNTTEDDMDVEPTSAVELEWIKVNGDLVDLDDSDENIVVDLNEDIDIRVKLQANEDVEDVEVQVRLVGYDYNDVHATSDTTRPFDMESGDTETQDLMLRIPLLSDKRDYGIRVTVYGPDNGQDYIRQNFVLRVKGPETALRIRDITFSPSDAVIAGRLLVSQVRLENIGEDSLDDIKVRASIPALGPTVSDSKFLDEKLDGAKVGRGDKEITEDLYLRIPECTPAGEYTVQYVVEFDEYDSVTATEVIRVLADNGCNAVDTSNTQPTERTVIVPPSEQTIAAGQSGTFPIIITNAGTTDASYVISVRGVEGWGVAEVTDPAPLVAAGQSKTVYVYVSANEDATPGQRVFSVQIAKGADTKEIPVTANIVEGAKKGLSLRNGLEIALIVLIILLIILGLIIGLSKVRDNGDDDERGQTYY